jgi:hypothetical protein
MVTDEDEGATPEGIPACGRAAQVLKCLLPRAGSAIPGPYYRQQIANVLMHATRLHDSGRAIRTDLK